MTFGKSKKKQLKDWWAYGDNIAMDKAFAYEDVKEAVLKFLHILNQLDKQYNIPNELFDEYYNVFGDFEDEK